VSEVEVEVSESEQGLGKLERGRDVWFKKTYGGEKFFAFLPNHPDPTKRITIGFEAVINTPRSVRFDQWGVINDPDCAANPAGGPDICTEADATGVVGMRKFPGPGGTTMYGSTCASCHAGFDPINPPANPNDPTWDNIHATIGNQYTKFGKIFAANLAPTDVRRLLFASWPDGAVDTQLLFSDGIHNPGVVTAFWEWKHRPTFDVGMDDEKMRNGQGGEDDVGADLAALRVYTNIGVCFQECTLPAITTNTPIDIAACRANCADFPPEKDIEALGKFLGSFKAPEFPGKAKDHKRYDRGKKLFKDNCASCHDMKGEEKHVLSDDEVIALTADPANTTNTCRSLTNMWERGKLWAQFSSEVYKQRVEAGQRGYRNMPLAGIWSTAPFTHNQSIGVWAPASATPEQRAAAYRTSMLELMQPSRTPKVNIVPPGFGPISGLPVTAVFSRDAAGNVLCTDYVENRGHYYGSNLSASDKDSLIYWLQYQ
jgi:mono/diheme cytochrome c family protein